MATGPRGEISPAIRLARREELTRSEHELDQLLWQLSMEGAKPSGSSLESFEHVACHERGGRSSDLDDARVSLERFVSVRVVVDDRYDGSVVPCTSVLYIVVDQGEASNPPIPDFG